MVPNTWKFGCDQCSSTLDTAEEDRRAAWNTLKREGWQFFHLDKHHSYHFCSERCIEEWLKERRR